MFRTASFLNAGTFSAPSPISGGPIDCWFKRFLVFVTGILLMNGLLLLINPEFAATRWAWVLSPLDARMVSAWFLGWSVWCGTKAFARGWDDIRTAAHRPAPGEQTVEQR